MPRALSFDYGNVLGTLDLDELARRLAERGRPTDVAELRARIPAAYSAHDEVLANGGSHEAGWRALMATLVGPDEATIDALWAAQPTRNLWRHVPPEARALLAELSAAGVPMVVTSNSEGRAAELLEELGIARYFRRVLDSGRLGVAKPDRRIFELAAGTAGVAVGDLVHVGDSESADVVGARQAGAIAVRFDGAVPERAAQTTVAHARAASYPELRAVLLRLLAGTRGGEP